MASQMMHPILIWILASYSPGPSGWHVLWLQLTKDPLDKLPLPTLKGPALDLCGRLRRRGHDEKDFRSVQVNHWRFLNAYTATLVYVKSKHLGPKFRGCPTCHVMYLRAFPNSPRDNWEDSGADVEHPRSAEQTLLPPASYPGHDDKRLLEEESSLAVSSRVGPIVTFKQVVNTDCIQVGAHRVHEITPRDRDEGDARLSSLLNEKRWCLLCLAPGSNLKGT
ncbi:hypothetical protein JVT61DRAFT_7189 [Boletus reticuloceps]|uniref:Uncharacterized protein n=1 Tax=Boletus reticuloceps TaxID=495285 RepID=A0A8I3A5U2_9AGAM|nr:hypothetical protein JVT61DRAFT_7189 [Boletus reticuloceps]